MTKYTGKLIPILSLILALPYYLWFNATPVYAMEQVIQYTGIANTTTTTPHYRPLMGNVALATTETTIASPMPTDGSISNLQVALNTALSGDNYTVTLMLAGNPTALTATVTDGNTIASDTTHSITVTAGQLVDWKIEISGVAEGKGINITAKFTGNTANESILIGGTTDTQLKTGNEYSCVSGGKEIHSATEADFKQIIPTPGTLRNLYYYLSTDPGTAPDAYRLTLNKDGVSQSLTVTITADSVQGSDVSHNVTVAAGNDVTMFIEPLNVPTASPAGHWSMVFAPDTDGESLLLGNSYDDLSNSATEYHVMNGDGSSTWFTTETSRAGMGDNSTYKNLYVELSTNPGLAGSGDKYVFTVMVNSTNSSIAVEILETATTGNDTTHTATITTRQRNSLRNVPTSTPTVADAYWGLVSYIEPSAGEPSLTNSPSAENLGSVAESSTYYAKGSAPNNPVEDGDCTFTITNDGSIAIDIDVHGHNFTGGNGWTLTSGAPGSATVRMTVYYSGQNPASGVILTTSDQTFYENLAASDTLMWDLKLETGTFTDGVEKTSNITYTATAH